MNKNSIKNALAASLSAEESSFKTRLAKAEAAFGDQENSTPSEKAASTKVASAVVPPAATKARSDSTSALQAPSKVVRDSFTMPEDDYARIGKLRTRCLQQNLPINKSEVLRAGLLALCELTDEQLASVMGNLKKVKTGRPAQS